MKQEVVEGQGMLENHHVSDNLCLKFLILSIKGLQPVNCPLWLYFQITVCPYVKSYSKNFVKQYMIISLCYELTHKWNKNNELSWLQSRWAAFQQKIRKFWRSTNLFDYKRFILIIAAEEQVSFQSVSFFIKGTSVIPPLTSSVCFLWLWLLHSDTAVKLNSASDGGKQFS